MNVQENVPLSGYSTMRLGGNAQYLTEINDWHEIPAALQWANERHLPVIMIGRGSNIVWRDEGFPGLVLVNKIMRFEPQLTDDDNLYVTVGAGENWDSVVAHCVDLGFSGIEFLSLIPGTTGATPVQNVGAYGREIKDVLVSVEAYDPQVQKLISIPTADCAFGYRTSRFKTTDRGRFFITAITMHLTKLRPMPPFYSALQSYFDEHGIKDYSPASIRAAVIAIRESKLPNPAHVANNGSFFANPIVTSEQLVQLRADFPMIKYWQMDDGRYKLSGAWLIESAGFKGVNDPETGMAVWPAQSLVLVNEHAKRTADLLTFRQRIIDSVNDKFGILLEQEPELLP